MFGGDLSYRYNIYDNKRVGGPDSPGNLLSIETKHMKPENVVDLSFKTTKGENFMKGGNPDGWSSRDKITLSYGSQRWNGNDCRDYLYKGAIASNNNVNQHDWWCQFDC